MTGKIIGGAGFLAAALLAAAATDSRLAVRRTSVPCGKITAPIRVAHISDLHESLFGDGQRTLIHALHVMKPDLIVFTGDMIEDDDSDPREGSVITTDNLARPLLETAPKIAPCFMVLGNHESNIPRTDLLCDELDAFGINVLHRAHDDAPDMVETLEIHGNPVCICGADDPYFDRRERPRHPSMAERMAEDRDRFGHGIMGWRGRLRAEYAAVAADTRLTLLLSHRPEEFSLYRELGFDAAFSGHAHGGQWRIPLLVNGVYSPHQGLFPQHAGGVYSYEPTETTGKFTHIVSRGLSKKRMVRIFNRPELWQVDFVPEE